MEFTILKPVDFMQGFIHKLAALNKSCESISDREENERAEKVNELTIELSKVEEEKEHVRRANDKKNIALKKYEAELQELVTRDKPRQEEIYAKITQAKFSGNEPEVERLRVELFANKEQIKQDRDKIWQEYQLECAKISQEQELQQQQKNKKLSSTRAVQSKELDSFNATSEISEKEEIDKEFDGFKSKFDPEIIESEYAKILDVEYKRFIVGSFVEHYQCVTGDYAENVRIANLEYDLQPLNLDEHAQTLLETHYPSLYRRRKLIIPYCTAFDENFNYLFAVNQGDAKGRETLVDRACSLVMRLFMTIPPNKVNFTFIDPIDLGHSFAIFTRLVDVDDRTSKVINGKIWTSAADIDERLRVLTDHIANVTQRCLQGQYDNIHKYNAIAGQNAEPYQILVIMDFPGSFKEDSLHKLEQIISTGPKCGVYTIILKSGEQSAKITDDKLKTLVHNIETQTERFVVKGEEILLVNADFTGKMIPFNINPLLSTNDLNVVIPKLKEGIKNAEKIVISFNERKEMFPEKSNWFKGNSSSELVIPLGIHGVNNVQNLVFGANAYHALIIGQTGSGKSSLLHTIIMSSLIRYPADELSIFLVDFKRGVEFKIYANHRLEAFRAVAIESEREFGESVLAFLDKEQSRRAEMFRRENVDNIQAYRARKGKDGKNFLLPRILLIIDEFHVLFSSDGNSMGKKASSHLEQIIKQGRAFGIHVVLASQTMANVGGIHQSLWGQVGIRIALKCPPADAKLILAEDNDGVDLLASNEPGMAVYNSDCGNKIANTVFRVAYIEQDTQENLLKDISNEAPKPEIDFSNTRVMVSNIEDNLYHPYQKFIRNGKSDAFKENDIFIGEPLQLSGKLRASFKAKDNSNMLIIGNDAQKARAMFVFSSLSLSIHTLAQNDWKKTSNLPCVHIMDFAPPEEGDDNVLMTLGKEIPNHLEYETFNDSIDILKTLHQKLQTMGNAESQYLLIFGLQGARSLRQNSTPYQGQNRTITGIDDDMGLDIGIKQSLSPYQMLCNVLQEGPTKKIHAIIWADNFKTFQAHYPGLLSLFDLRVGFTMPNEDSVLFIEEPEGSHISENNAVFSYNGNQKFRPYQTPDSGWLKEMCKRINSYQ
jgi:hypothetical protein